MGLTGDRHVRVFRPALEQARRLFPHARDFYELRAQALKLRFWPRKTPENEQGQLLDLNWTWIRALRSEYIGELRIDDVIGGFDNLRLVFWDASEMAHNGLPMIWVLSVLQKKRQDWSSNNLKTFKAQRKLVRFRFYTEGGYRS